MYSPNRPSGGSPSAPSASASTSAQTAEEWLAATDAPDVDGSFVRWLGDEGRHDAGRDALFDEKMVRPRAAKVVRRDAAIVLVAGHVGGRRAGVVDPVLQRTRGTADKWFIVREFLGLNVAVDESLNVDGEPHFAVLAALVLTGGVLPTDNFEPVVTLVAHARNMARLDIKDFGDAETTIAHESDGDFALEGVGRTGEFPILLARYPDVERLVPIPFCSHSY